MSVHPNTLGATRKPFWRRHQFWRVTLPVLAIAGGVIAGILVYNAFVGSNGTPRAQGWGVTYPTPKTPKTVKLDPTVRTVVKQFIATAVARKNLRAAYSMAGPQVRQGMSLEEWLKGEIAVVPFPVDAKTKADITVENSYANSAKLQILLVTPGREVKTSPHTFFADMIKKNGKWLVNSWVPRWTPPIPTLQH